MSADTTVVYFHSAMTGAPSLAGQAGTLIAVLDACLVNGFGAGTVDSVVISGGVATVTRSAGHSFEVGTVALISGATVSGGSINGRQRVLAVTSSTWTFDATGLADQSATGTITAKLAPAGWTKPFSGTNLAAYKGDVTGTGCLLRVDDTGSTDGRVVGYESMADINSGTGPFPTALQLSGGGWWGKSSTADSTARSWILIGDNRGFIFATACNASYLGYYNTMAFGDIAPIKTPDPYACILAASNLSLVMAIPGSSISAELFCANDSDQYMWAPRAVTGIGSSKPQRRNAAIPCGTASGQVSGSLNPIAWMSYPNPADNGLYVSPMTVSESYSSRSCLRGVIPGVYFCGMGIGIGVFATRDTVTGISGMTGRTLRAIQSYYGAGFVDATGPWAR